MDDFVEWWRPLVPARKQYGFEVVFAFADRETNQFVWAVSHDGDFTTAEKAWLESPERAAIFEGAPQRIDQVFLAFVDPVHPVPAGG
jgi:hypothetical protein